MNTTTSGLRDRRLRLLRHFVQDAARGNRLEPAGVDDQIFALAGARAAVVAIARQSGKIGDERIARLRQAVEERRFADIRSADESDGGEHCFPAGQASA
jgi:hypothetical protein